MPSIFYKPKRESQFIFLKIMLLIALGVALLCLAGRAIETSDDNYCNLYPEAEYCEGLNK